MKNLRIFNHTKRKLRKANIHKVVGEITRTLHLKINDLEINFVDEKLIHDINKKYLQHDYSTDIITFNYSEDNSILEGEIFISVDDAQKNAKKFKVLLENEILRLLVHGILHMIGYDDIEPNDRRRMKRVENRLVKELWKDELKGAFFYDG